MSLLTGWIAVAAVLALLLGLWLMLAGRGMRQHRGLGGGKTVSLDRVMLTSHRLGLAGRPDRLMKADGTIIVEREIRCQFIILSRKDEPTPDFLRSSRSPSRQALWPELSPP